MSFWPTFGVATCVTLWPSIFIMFNIFVYLKFVINLKKSEYMKSKISRSRTLTNTKIFHKSFLGFNSLWSFLLNLLPKFVYNMYQTRIIRCDLDLKTYYTSKTNLDFNMQNLAILVLIRLMGISSEHAITYSTLITCIHRKFRSYLDPLELKPYLIYELLNL